MKIFMRLVMSCHVINVCHGQAFDSIVSKLLLFDRNNDLHFRIQKKCGQI